jgi:hypothetical protein
VFILIQQDQVGVTVALAGFLQYFPQGAIVPLHQGSGQGGIEQRHGAADALIGLVGQLLLGEPGIARHQHEQHDDFHQDAGQGQLDPQGEAGSAQVQGSSLLPLEGVPSTLRVSPR